MACICILPGIEKFHEDLFVSAQSSRPCFIRRNKTGRLGQLLNPCSAPDAVPDTSPVLTFESSSKSPCQAGGIRICQWGIWGSGKVISIESLCCRGVCEDPEPLLWAHLSRPCGSSLALSRAGQRPQLCPSFSFSGRPPTMHWALWWGARGDASGGLTCLQSRGLSAPVSGAVWLSLATTSFSPQ